MLDGDCEVHLWRFVTVDTFGRLANRSSRVRWRA
jgi:hypothetical protein